MTPLALVIDLRRNNLPRCVCTYRWDGFLSGWNTWTRTITSPTCPHHQEDPCTS